MNDSKIIKELWTAQYELNKITQNWLTFLSIIACVAFGLAFAALGIALTG